MRNNACGFVAVLTAIAVFPLLAFAGTSVSDATLLRMAAMKSTPVIDGTISIDEQKYSSVQYGPISGTTKLMSVRYGSFFIGYTDAGIYFAARTSAPPRPQKFTAADRVTLSLLPEGCNAPKEFFVCVADGSSNLPPGTKSAMRHPCGIDICGMECVETEMFIPFTTLGTAKPSDGAKWGLQMSVTYSSEPETAVWHLPSVPGEMGCLVFDSCCPVAGLLNFNACELWRPSGGYFMVFRVDNSTVADVKMSSKSVVHRGIGFARLADDPEKVEGVSHNKITEFHGRTVKAGQKTDFVHPEYALWPGKVNTLVIDIAANGVACYRRQIKWDLSRGLKWKDAEGLPTLETGFYPSVGNRFRAEYKVNGKKNLVTGLIRVEGADGKTYWQKEIKGSPYIPEKELCETNLPGLPLQDYVAKFSATDANGKTYTDERTFAVRKFPWQGLNLGKDRIVVPPFKPIRVAENGDIALLQTAYRPGGVLWSEVHALGENLMTGAVELEVNGGRFNVTGERIVSAEPDRVVREVTAEKGDLALKVTQDYDYDGFCWTTMEFTPKSPVRVESLRVKVPLKNELAKYYNVCNRTDKRAYEAPDFTLPQGDGEVWSSATNEPTWAKQLYPASVQTYVWFGGASKGFCWMVNSVKGMSLKRDTPPQRIVRANGAATLYSDIVNKPVTWDKPVAICMGFQPTPVKPQNAGLRVLAEDMWSSNCLCPSNSVRKFVNGAKGFMMPTLLFPIHTFPAGDRSLFDWVMSRKESDHAGYMRRIKEFTDRHADWFVEKGRMTAAAYRREQVVQREMTGAKQKAFYLDPMLRSCFWPEDEMYKAEWSPYEWPRDNFMSEYGGKICESRIDKLLYDAKVALDLGYNEIYYDVFGCHRDYNFIVSPEKAYDKGNGSIQISGNDLLEQREIVKRTATLCYLNGANFDGRPTVSIHTTDCYVVPVMSFADVNLSCERGALGGDWQDRFPESYSITEIAGLHAGTIPQVIVSARNGDAERRGRELRTLMAHMCAYGYFSLSDQEIVPRDWFVKAWNIVYDFGWGRPHVKIHHYYDETPSPVRHDGKDVRLTVASKPGSALLLFGNLGDDADVTFDASGLGFGNVKVSDAETGKALPGNRFRIDRHGYRMFKVERSAK